jgi:hypothetical protein
MYITYLEPLGRGSVWFYVKFICNFEQNRADIIKMANSFATSTQAVDPIY